jgi:hypothetical protein
MWKTAFIAFDILRFLLISMDKNQFNSKYKDFSYENSTKFD